MTLSSIKSGRASQGLSQKGGVCQRPFELGLLLRGYPFLAIFIKIMIKKISLARHLSRLELGGLQTVLQPQNVRQSTSYHLLWGIFLVKR